MPHMDLYGRLIMSDDVLLMGTQGVDKSVTKCGTHFPTYSVAHDAYMQVHFKFKELTGQGSVYATGVVIYMHA